MAQHNGGFRRFALRVICCTIAAGCSTADSVMAADQPIAWATGAAFDQQLAAPIDVLWADLPFREAIDGVSRARRVAILIDRRVDPSQKVSLTAGGRAMESTLQAIARRRHFDTTRLGNLIYLGPAETCRHLATVSKGISEQLRRLSPTIQTNCRQSKRMAWDDLANPRELLRQIGADAGITFENLDRIPHDLWAAADLPPMPTADQLTLIGIQYDFTFKAEGKARLAIVPLPEFPAATASSITPKPGNAARHSTKPPRSRAAATIDEVRIDRMEVQEKPLKPVMQQLAQRLKLDLRWDDQAIAAAGIDLDQRVSLLVENATVDDLLTGLLKGTGLTYERRQRVVEIRPAAVANPGTK